MVKPQFEPPTGQHPSERESTARESSARVGASASAPSPGTADPDDDTASTTIEERLQAKNASLVALNAYSLALASVPYTDNVFAVAATKLKELTGAAAAGISTYDDATATLTVAHTSFSDTESSMVLRLLGRRFEGLRIPVAADVYEMLRSNAVLDADTLNTLSFGVIPPTVGSILEMAFDIGWFKAMAILHEGQMMGTLVLAGRRGTRRPEHEELAAFSSVTSNALRRWMSDQASLVHAARVASLFRAAPAGIGALTGSTITEVNDQLGAMLGRTRGELIGQPMALLFASTADHDRCWSQLQEQLSRTGASQIETELARRDGSMVPVILSVASMVVGGGIENHTFIALDIGDAKRTRTALEAERERLQLALSATRQGWFEVNVQTGAVTVSPEYPSMLGYAPEDFASSLQGWISGVHPEDRGRVVAVFQDCAATGTARTAEYRRQKRSGEFTWVRSIGKIVAYDDQQRPLRMAGTHMDISDLKRAEAALIESEERFRLLVQYSNDLIVVLTADGVITSLTGPFERILGYAPGELDGTVCFDVVHPDDVAHAVRSFRSALEAPAVPHRAEFRCRRRDGTWVDLESVGVNLLHDPVIHGLVLNVRDISERKRAERERADLQERLQQASKMEAVGQLAGGVAHDFNNLLTSIRGNVELALMDVDPSHVVVHPLEQVAKAAASAASLTRQLLAFSRRQIIAPTVVDLDALIAQFRKMLTRLIGETVEVRVVPGTEVASVKVDAGQFEQVLLNLAINARDAMPDGGTLTIATANTVLDADYCASRPGLEPGPYVQVTVSDTGHGMTDEVRSHLFEPFFTTKGLGRGTGLGLATSLGTVQQAGGTIDVESVVGRGSTLRVLLPALNLAPDAVSEAQRSDQLEPGTETVLLVEDDESVRGLAVTMLTRLGYHVLSAAEGREALAVAGARAEPIDLMLTDVVMPGMNGAELAERLAAIHPETRVLYTSGYAEKMIAHQGIIDAHRHFIAKPYSLPALAKRVREVLDQPQG
jgi:two-component system, cell cycle sensor histidine kinase and response regulator CckA